jgi:hypothetical protein
MATLRLCSIPDCGKPHNSRGWCAGHYERWKRHGDPLGGRTPNGEQWQYMLDHMWDDCPVWPYSRTEFGRGRIYDRHRRGQAFVHQIVCEMVRGPSPSRSHEVAHNCGRGDAGCFGARCVEWKTRIANQADRLLHGTSNRGEKHGQSKLDTDKVRTIRALAGVQSQGSIARDYGVTRETIRDIQKRRIWTWLA